ncbi:hypothetical protein RBSWK_02860 [Rhodopirellula baltica SWK14]|uniref:Uncharacterized protein n=1 Tax=Rhodopirellula baltica SWK14 TaxID=993516 RepID=L7CFL5_RHOBT|nr:hypothetical protein RBSWK_02860 [Rhodopirellula baltica SWK14]
MCTSLAPHWMADVKQDWITSIAKLGSAGDRRDAGLITDESSPAKIRGTKPPRAAGR